MTPRRSLLRFDPTELTITEQIDMMTCSMKCSVCKKEEIAAGHVLHELGWQEFDDGNGTVEFCPDHAPYKSANTCPACSRFSPRNEFHKDCLEEVTADQNSFIPHGSYDLERDLPF